MDASSKESVTKTYPVLIPAAALAANDATLSIREAALQLLTSFAVKAGSMKAIDKVPVAPCLAFAWIWSIAAPQL